MKVIIWGHKLFSHSHGYGHYGFYKAFKALGYETYWIDNNDNLPDAISDAIFLTEGGVDQKIPLFKDAKYILHHCNLEKYKNVGCKYINLCNYVEPCERGISMNYGPNAMVKTINQGTVIKIKDFCFYDNENLAIYQPWATDLLPNEIDENNPIMFNPNLKDIYYIGQVHPDTNLNMMQKFQSTANSCGKQVKFVNSVSFEDNLRLVKDSYISFDLRGKWHQECGYIPCRIWKSLSYGKFIGVNSLHIYKMLGDFVAYENDPSILYFKTENQYAYLTKEKIRQSMLYIKENHTYINRVENLLKILEV